MENIKLQMAATDKQLINIWMGGGPFKGILQANSWLDWAMDKKMDDSMN